MISNSELLYTKNAKIWISNPETVWESAYLKDNYKRGDKVLKIVKDSGQELDIILKDETDLPPLRNPSILIGQNDLTALSYLHEPGVLYNLEVRFRQRQAIYTYCGIVLVAINPYADLPLYGPDIIRVYRGHSMGELEPHIFAVAEDAYTKLEREKCNLSIIVSGESGAGKTVSAKYAMRYFAAIGGSESETQIERKVLASSPIMEAIGNAKTTRNDNSSRFGKFTKLLFKNDMGVMALTGATMQTYLLEKSRVVFQAPDERNYHIFYQLCAYRDKYPELLLDHQNTFRYLNCGGCVDIDKISDRDQFTETLTALNILGFCTQEINDIMKILAGILHLGNIELIRKYQNNSGDSDQDACDISPNNINIHVMSEILKINAEDLQKWLISRQIQLANENVITPNNLHVAEAARDALAKHLYAKLFQYIVQVINKTLICSRKQNYFIGVLDIYGFETFETNSFEQFCINYANEKLQQQFNQHVFKLEQEEYLKEGIVWTMIDFYDNQPCIDLIESKLGILDLLDEECKMPRGSDESWARKLIEKCAKYKHFEKPRFGTTSFLVKHFSEVVEYDVYGFIEKNRDTVSKELVNVIRQSQLGLCKKLMELDDTDSHHLERKSSSLSLSGRLPMDQRKKIISSKQHKQTVGSQFRDSLSALISTLHATTPHYVRCIKPNEDKASFKWVPSKIVQQLRACGVLETVRISGAGFPSRWTYCDFYNRYRLLCSSKYINEKDLKITCTNIIHKWINDQDKYRFGNTQIFFRAGEVAYLEQIRSNIRQKYIITVQAIIREFICRRRFKRLQRTILGIQCHARGFLTRKKVKNIRENRAAVTIQRYVRGWLCRRRYEKIKFCVFNLQRYFRGFLARRRYKVAIDNYRATQIQRFCRGYLARVASKKRLRDIIKCQAVVRGFLARRLYKRMKAEARTISHIQKMYKGLENKIISLQQRIDELNKENVTLKAKNSEMIELKQKLGVKRNYEKEIKLLKFGLDKKDQNIMLLNKQLDMERDEKMQLLEEKNRIEKELIDERNTWKTEKDELKRQVDEMVEIGKKAEIISTHRVRLLSEVDSNDIHQAYQRIIKEKEIIENENHLLKEEINRLQQINENNTDKQQQQMHTRSISDVSSQNEEDYGYSSAKNTLELRRVEHKHKESDPATVTSSERNIVKTEMIPTPKTSQTVLILKLRKILEEEKNKNDALIRQVTRLKNKTNTSLATEDSIRVSELEVEYEKLRHDYELLRDSIRRGDEHETLESQYNALQEEVKRRREECIQLRAVLAEQSQSLKSLGNITSAKVDLDRFSDNNELFEAFEAQKLVNRQLESELTALTEENNARLADLTKLLEETRNEKNRLQTIFQETFDDHDETNIEILRKNEKYLKYELEKSYDDYATLQEKMNELNTQIAELTRTNNLLTSKLHEHGVQDITLSNDELKNVVAVKKKTQHYQGIFKYKLDDIDKIFQKLIIDLTPRTAIGLLPGLPAYIILMCIRYTDLINADEHVKMILSNFVHQMKKFYRVVDTLIEYKILWLVNTLTLHNLLKQYGGRPEYVKIVTETQKTQQLKNFDLSEYRQVVYEIIINLYGVLVNHVEETIKPFIVPAILDHDEMSRGRSAGNRGRTMSLDSSTEIKMTTEPKSLVKQLEYFYKQFEYFGLDSCYSEQIFMQLMYFICSVSMNSLMLRGDLCMWKTGMKIRYNVSCLEDWIRKKKMSMDVASPLLPLIQVSSLLQSRKNEEDVQSIFDLCPSLTSAQVLKIIKSYNPDDCENRISDVFIEKLTQKLKERETNVKSDVFTMDEKYVYTLKVVFKYSDIKLEEIELPKSLNLGDLLTKI